MLDGLKNGLYKILDGYIPEHLKDKVLEFLYKKKEEELKNSPKIALIGKTGVGKSSTINSLFKTKLNFSHTEACTQTADPIVLTNGKGEIIVYDMPGLGEDEEKDLIHIETYKRVLPQCDVVLWILNIDDREMSYQQMLIRQIKEYCESRLVVCANKADIIFPNDWNNIGNFPSEAQIENLEKRIVDIRSKLLRVIPSINEDQIVYYSALKRYQLQVLFQAMMDACPARRSWVLEERMDLEDFRELIDKDILNEFLAHQNNNQNIQANE